ncbi:MAG: lasso peptide biosynthesis protein [bacterium]
MAKRDHITCSIIKRIQLFFEVGFYTFYMPFLENKYGLKELFEKLSLRRGHRICDKFVIRQYVHIWLSIKGLLKPQHCWNRTLLLYKFLRSAGYNAVIYTGIRKDAINRDAIIGHSWITIDGVVFDDKENIADEHYITFHYP